MAGLATISDVRAEGNLKASAPADAVLQPGLTLAVIQVGRLLGADTYAEVLAESATVQRRIDCQKAEALLGLANALPSLNIETAGAGLVSSKGWNESRSQLMSVADVEHLAESFRSKGMALLSPYTPTAETVTSFGGLNLAVV